MISERIIQTDKILSLKVKDKDLTEIIGVLGSNLATTLRPQLEWTYEKT